MSSTAQPTAELTAHSTGQITADPHAKNKGWSNLERYKWKPGQTGNPNGQNAGRKASILVQMKRLLCEDDEKLNKSKCKVIAAELYRLASTPGPQQLQAIMVWLDRIDGKVLQRVEIEANALRAKCLACVDFLRARALSNGVELDELLILQAVAAEYPEARDVLAAEFEAAEQARTVEVEPAPADREQE